jgi:ATP-binding cassette subfamily F protein 3
LAEQLSSGEDAAALSRYSHLQAELERLDGYTYESRMRTVLGGLGFGAAEHHQSLAELSGGQRTRALLARLLLEGADVLLLDEPTNYLDLEAVEWLESWLPGCGSSYLVVSHDRWFLDRVTERTWEIAFGGLETYRGGYSAYLRQRQERYERRLKEWQAQQAYIEKTQDYIRRFLAGQRTKEAQGRRTRLQRFLRDEAIERPQQQRRINLRLPSGGRTGDIVLRLTGLRLGYAASSPPILSTEGETEIHRGQRVAVVGPNGAGKTTLVRAILGQLTPTAGEVRLGAKVEIGYLPQTQEDLRGSQNVVQALQEVAPEGTTVGELRDLLGSFLFHGDDVDKRIEQLSGGERSRVALARLVLQGANFLILDEPTNHLDITSQEVLEQVIGDFDGTVLLVSHDRYLIQSLATRIWTVDSGRLSPFDGNWLQYCEWRDRVGAAVPSPDSASMPGAADDREARRQARRQRKAEEQLQARHLELETQIAELEARKAQLGDDIGRAGEAQDVDRVRRLVTELEQVDAQLTQRLSAWEEVGSQLEESTPAP